MNNKIILFDIDYTLFDTDVFKKTKLQKHLVYDETLNVLQKLSKVADLGIFSEGEHEFQKAKLVKTNIHKYFNKNHIHIVEKKDVTLSEVLKKYDEHIIYLVDDKLTILYQAKSIMPSLNAIWVKRGMYADSQKPIEKFTPDAIIKNLNELIPIVSS